MDELMERRTDEFPQEIGNDVEDDGEAKVQLSQDITPHEIVLSFDHILEQILDFLDTPELLKCRLVSRRFLKFAQVPLEEHLCLQFHSYERNTEGNLRALPQLTELLKSSLSVAIPNSEATTNSFPCTDFFFHGAELGDYVLQNFINTNGHSIRHLWVQSYGDQIHENILIDQLFNLLTRQAPLLESLTLYQTVEVEWQQGIPNQFLSSIEKDYYRSRSLSINSVIELQPRIPNQNRNPGFRSNRSPLLETDPEFQQISARVKSLPSKSSLKYFEMSGDASAKIFELVFQLCPQLQDVPQDCENLIYLLQPISRVYLLTSLNFRPVTETFIACLPYRMFDCINMETMQNFSMNEFLGLRKIRLDIATSLTLCNAIPEFEHKLASVINRILHSSRETLKRLEFSSLTILRGMRMPLCMPNLQKIIITMPDRFQKTNSMELLTVSWSQAFPKLTRVELFFYENFISPYFENYLSTILNFLDFHADGEYTALSLGVKNVILNESCFRTPEGLPANIPVYVCQRIQKLFPNASVKKS